ncbi:MAG: hypothetical protein ACK4UO_16470 [Pseudolabrys sp.]
MSSVATLKRRKVTEPAAESERRIVIPRRRHARSAEAAIQRRELALLLRSIKTLLQQSP